MGFELAFKTDGFEGDVEMIEDTWCRDEGPQEDDADSVHTAVRLGRKAIPPTKLSPKLGKLARSNPSVPSKSPWYLSRLPLTSELTFSTMVEAVFGSRGAMRNYAADYCWFAPNYLTKYKQHTLRR